MNHDESRRDFLKRSIFLIGGLMAAGIAYPALTYFLSPLWRKEEEDWLELADVGEIPKGEPVKIDFVRRRKEGWVTVEGRSSAWVVTADGRNFSVFDPLCTHLGCPYRWDTQKKQFLCPCHNAAFAVDGRVLSGPPPRPLDQYPVKVVGGKLMIQPVPEKKEG